MDPSGGMTRLGLPDGSNAKSVVTFALASFRQVAVVVLVVTRLLLESRDDRLPLSR